MENSMNDIQKLVQEIATYCNSYTSADSIPTIEVDILKQKTRELYDKLSRIDSAVVEQPTQEKCEQKESVQIIEPQFVECQQEEEKPVEIQEPEIVQQETTIDEQPVQPVSTVTSETGKKNIETVNDRLSHISELTPDTFGFNDRIHYRTLLFNNDKDLFEKTIAIINESESFDSALQYLREHFDWDYEKNDVKKFITFIKRRFQ
ncbi:MAG: hypothetical protein J6X43_03355 [Bacteroidales bacterium]|nr:hypothetical protein [Bacteroidales bacterium]